MVRRFVGCTVICVCAAALAAGARAEDAVISARHHAWGRFRPGAWKLVRVVTETFDDHGSLASSSLTETKTTLEKVEDDGVTLQIEVDMEVAGKQFDAQPQCLKQGFHGEVLSPDLKVKPSEPAHVTVEDRKVPCRRQQLELGGDHKTLISVYYSDTVAPYVLKRESVTTDNDGKTVLGQTNLDVVATDLPWQVLDEIRTVSCVKTVQRHAKGTVTTLSMTSPAIPGGVVYHTSKETDSGGRLTRRSVLTLVGYGLQSEQERGGLFGRGKRARGRKPATYSAPW
jgi:hypothetical protein